MWGQEQGNPNSNLAVQPLQDLDFADWWWHGPQALNDPPADNAITELVAGGTIDFEITGNKAFTSMGKGLCCQKNHTPRNIPEPWSNGMNGLCSANIHAPQYKDVAGCALAIAYKSNQKDVAPEDFVIFSVVHDCIARQLQTFDIPALPACPDGKCMCAWFWIHNSIGGTDQNYMTGFQCNVTNPSNRTIGKPQPPVRCDGQPPCYLYPGWGNTTKDCPDVKNPFYWANNQGNNIQNPTNAQCAPTYNYAYGFADGAQNGIFVDTPAPPGPPSYGDTLYSDNFPYPSFVADTSAINSPSFQTQLIIQGDGNVVLVQFTGNNTNKVLWSTNTSGKGTGPYRLTMQKTGNLALTDMNNMILWSSYTTGMGVAPYRLKIRDVGQLVIVDRDSTPIWSYDKGIIPIITCEQNE